MKDCVKLQMAGYVAPDESYLLFSAFDAASSQGGSDLRANSAAGLWS
jgi:hypothetical protein